MISRKKQNKNANFIFDFSPTSFWKSKLSRLSLVSFKSPAENETKSELSLKTKKEQKEMLKKMLVDFLVKSKITDSLGDECLSVLFVENQPRK